MKHKPSFENIQSTGEKMPILALAGSPNVGKSTVFNALTGLNQHTGNWTGKTVSTAAGTVKQGGCRYLLCDVPGTYSLCARSEEEAVARDFLLFGDCDGIIAVCDALCLERNLSLVLQIAEYTPKITLCVNLLDQAEKKGVKYDLDALSALLGIEIAPCSAKRKKGLTALMDKTAAMLQKKEHSFLSVFYGDDLEDAIARLIPEIDRLCQKKIPARFTALKLLCDDKELVVKLETYAGVDFTEDDRLQEILEDVRKELYENGLGVPEICDAVSEGLSRCATALCKETRLAAGASYGKCDRAADRILTGKYTAFPIMLLLLAVIFWLTLAGANVPSEALNKLLFSFESPLFHFFTRIGLPNVLCKLLVEGVYRVTVWIVSVMLPPMAIFFPLFTLLEDIGVLPRIAFNLDRLFATCKACGKQALTMCMGFGCNAAGVVGCRIIDSPRERLIAILTNSLVPCNGRFPLLITMISLFFVWGSGLGTSLVSAVLLAALIVGCVFATLLVSRLLSATLLRGKPSAFTLELPPYRCPNIPGVFVRSFLDRTVFVLGRAVMTAAPAGLIIWLLANISLGDLSLLGHACAFLDPVARFFGMDGVIFMAFFLALPASEIVIPVIVLAYMAESSLASISIAELGLLLTQSGWTWVTALCVVTFSVFHFPCATTLLTIKKETGSWKWTALAAVLPTTFGLVLCAVIRAVTNILL